MATTDDETEIDRPPMWWYFKSPALLVAIVAGSAWAGVATLEEMLTPALFLFTLWLAWSVTSGAYPWSLPPGAFR